MSMKIYNFDNNGYFTNESIAKIDPMESKEQGKDIYLLPKNATFVAPIEYNSELEKIRFQDNQWIIEDIVKQGTFYLKSNGEEYQEIKIKEQELYTQIKPYLEIFEDLDEENNIILKSEISFVGGVWVYTKTTKSQFVECKINKIKEIKQEAFKRIDNIYSQYKQNNIAAAVIEILNKENLAVKQNTTYQLTEIDILTLQKSKQCKEYISLIRTKSDELEALVQSKKAINTIEAIKVSDDIYWI